VYNKHSFIRTMDILYYSNYCKHCSKLIQLLAKNNLTDKINCLCIDKRKRDPKTGQTVILLDNGKQAILPPNVHSVPALLMIKQQYRVIVGDEITSYLEPLIKSNTNAAVGYAGEPSGYSMMPTSGGVNIVSEQYTFYNAEPEELSAKGTGKHRQMFNYVSVNDNLPSIETPPDNYRPDKISTQGITLDVIQKKRNEDVPQMATFIP